MSCGSRTRLAGLTDRRLTIRHHTPRRKKTAGQASSRDTQPAVEVARVEGIRSYDKGHSDSVSQIRAGETAVGKIAA